MVETRLRIFGIGVVMLLVAGCAGSGGPDAPSGSNASAGDSSLPPDALASSGTSATEMTPVSTAGWMNVANYPFTVLAPSDWCVNDNGASRVFSAGACDRSSYCEMNYENGTADTPEAVLTAWFKEAYANRLSAGEQWGLSGLRIAGVPAAAQVTGSDGSLRFVAAKPSKSGQVGIWILDCEPLPPYGVIAAIIANATD